MDFRGERVGVCVGGWGAVSNFSMCAGLCVVVVCVVGRGNRCTCTYACGV